MRSLKSCFIVISAYTVILVTSGPCEELEKQWPNRYDNFYVHNNGNNYSVPVYGEGGYARAAAALMHTLLLHVVGYNATHVEKTLDLDNSNMNSPIVAPAVSMTCCRIWHHAMTKCSGSSIANSLHLLANVPSHNCEKYISSKILYINATIFEHCGFIPIKKGDNTTTYFLTLARKRIDENYNNYIKSWKLPLSFEFFPTYDLLRTRVNQLQKENKTFLFLDEDIIWIDNPKIFYVQNDLISDPISFSMNTIRVGDGIIIDRIAPSVSNLVRKFAPIKDDLQRILKNEAENSPPNIEDAACRWALNNTQYVQNWTYRPQTAYRIVIYFCINDPDIEKHLDIINLRWDLLDANINDLNYNFSYIKIQCDSSENVLPEKIGIMSKDNIITGAIVWSTGMAASTVNVTEKKNVILMVAGNNAVDLPLDTSSAVHATIAPLKSVINAYVELLDRCQWSRIAFISDKSTYSRKFIDLLLNDTLLLSRERIVDAKNIDFVLDQFNSEDARIFFINTNWDLASKILCSASKKGMTPAANIMWIVRDWRAVNCTKGDKKNSMYHFTIGVSWRGGPTSGGSPEVQSKLQNLWGIRGNILAGSAGGASLADAILLLVHGFAYFRRKFPSYQFNLHDTGNTEKFASVLQNLTTNGSVQQLKSDKTLVFIEKWTWAKGESVALWNVTRNGIIDIWPNKTVGTCEKIVGIKVADRTICYLPTGDDFAPKCQLVTVILVIIFLFLSFIALYCARQLRISKLRRQIEEERKRTYSSLDGYLIKRNSIKLLHVIGSGSNGVVHFAELKKPDEIVVVAAKEPVKGIPIIEVNEFLREACILASLRHDNIIRFVGICVGNGPPIILTEHAFYNNLQRYLVLRRQFAISARLGKVYPEEASAVSDSELTRFIKEAAQALEYLAEQRLIHRDLRASNCLVDKRRSLKLADFGLARELDCESYTYIGLHCRFFPVICTAPESLKLGVFSTASDIWALGVLMVEVATLGARPYGDWPVQKIVHYVSSGGHPPLPPDTSKYTRNLVMKCCQQDEKVRPTARDIRWFLERNPNTISAALLTPDLPKRPLNFK